MNWELLSFSLMQHHKENELCFLKCQKIRDLHVNHILQNMLAKLLIEVLCLGKDSPDAQKLLHYKAPKNARGVSTESTVNNFH